MKKFYNGLYVFDHRYNCKLLFLGTNDIIYIRGEHLTVDMSIFDLYPGDCTSL